MESNEWPVKVTSLPPHARMPGRRHDTRVKHLFVLADSLSFQGPGQPVPPTDTRLYPNVCAEALSKSGWGRVQVDLLARQGWTARDAWWALTKDPMAFGVYVHRADAFVIGVGGMDQLPAAIPTWWRDSIPYLRPGGLRRVTRRAYHRGSPWGIRLLSGWLRQLPQAATDRYLDRIITAVRHWRPGIPVVLMGPSPWNARTYPVQRTHAPAVAAARSWAKGHQVQFVDLDPLVQPDLASGFANPDGLHWAWATHERVGEALARALTVTGQR